MHHQCHARDKVHHDSLFCLVDVSEGRVLSLSINPAVALPTWNSAGSSSLKASLLFFGMNNYTDLAQQLYLVRSLSEQGFLTQRAKALLKGSSWLPNFAETRLPQQDLLAGLVLAGDEKINQICSKASIDPLQVTADRLFERAGMYRVCCRRCMDEAGSSALRVFQSAKHASLRS